GEQQADLLKNIPQGLKATLILFRQRHDSSRALTQDGASMRSFSKVRSRAVSRNRVSSKVRSRALSRHRVFSEV
ncbi:MAG: hypothetical protein WBC92_11635, partial [Terracidiphilus sp.]